MKDYAIERGYVKKVDTSLKSTKGFFFLRKMFTEYLNNLNVGFYDPCCPTAAKKIGIFLNSTDHTLNYIDPTTGAVTIIEDISIDSISTDTISEKTANVGVTVDGVELKDGGISSNSMFVGFYRVGPAEAKSGAGAISLNSYYTAWTTTGANAGTLADGTQIGQLKKITMVVDGGDGTLTPANMTGGTTITFNDAGDSILLMWNGLWTILENSGATVA